MVLRSRTWPEGTLHPKNTSSQIEGKMGSDEENSEVGSGHKTHALTDGWIVRESLRSWWSCWFDRQIENVVDTTVMKQDQ